MPFWPKDQYQTVCVLPTITVEHLGTVVVECEIEIEIDTGDNEYNEPQQWIRYTGCPKILTVQRPDKQLIDRETWLPYTDEMVFEIMELCETETFKDDLLREAC